MLCWEEAAQSVLLSEVLEAITQTLPPEAPPSSVAFLPSVLTLSSSPCAWKSQEAAPTVESPGHVPTLLGAAATPGGLAEP